MLTPLPTVERRGAPEPVPTHRREEHYMTDDQIDETEAGPPPEEEMFPTGSLPGDEISPQSLIKKGLPIELVVSLSKAEVPIRGNGLVNPNAYGQVLVTYLPGKLHELPIRQDEHDGAKVTGWKLTQDLRAMYVEDANDRAGLITAQFEALCATDGAGATALLANLRELATGLRAVA